MARASLREIAPWLGLAGLAFALDQLTKWLILANFALGDSVTVTSFFNVVRVHNEGKLDPSGAAMAKWWTIELQNKLVDRAVQLQGGYGYMNEYPVARAFVDSRIQTIYGGTTEIQKEIIGRSLGL